MLDNESRFISDEITLEAIEYDMSIRMTCLKLACGYLYTNRVAYNEIVDYAQSFYKFITNEEIDNDEN